MRDASLQEFIAALPKAELHVHLEGSIQPESVVELARANGLELSVREAEKSYEYTDFEGFLNAFKWVTAFLRRPEHYAYIAEKFAEQLLAQNVVYAEVTVSAGVMVLRKQDVEANFAAIREAVRPAERRGLRCAWIFDAVRQFGGAAAMEVARLAARMKPQGVVAFGLGGDELSLPAEEFRGVYDFARAQGLRCLAHAGEVGGPQSVGDAVEILGAERIGHGIAASAAGEVTSMLAERRIPVEICPTSNLRTGALARLLANPRAKIEQHPVRGLFDHGVPVTISTDDPAMFHTSLLDEYVLLERLGFTRAEIARVARASFEAAFLDAESKAESLKRFDEAAAAAGLV